MKLIVPTTFEERFIEAVADYPVERIYGSASGEARARADQGVPEGQDEELENHIAHARSRGIDFFYTMQLSCSGGHEFDGEGWSRLAKRLDWLVEVGAGGVVVSSPFIIEWVKQRYSALQVCVSTHAGVDTVEKALFYEDLGADCIYLSDFINRDFRLLRALKKRVGCDLALSVNLSCLMQCPLRNYHGRFVSHSAQSLRKRCYLDYSLAKCTQLKSASSVEVMKAPWIRPEDVVRYERMGFSHFKLAGRDQGSEWLLRAVAAYALRSYSGRLNDLVLGLGELDPFGRFPVSLDNSRLEGFIDFFTKKDCRLGCNGCTHCQEWLERAMSVDGDIRQYSERIDRFIRKFTSGSFKAPVALAS